VRYTNQPTPIRAARARATAAAALLFGLVVQPVALHAELTVTDIYQQPAIEGTRPSDVTISPDEKWVAYSWNPDGYRDPLNLYVVSTRGGEPRVLTQFTRDAVQDSVRNAWQQMRAGVGTAVVDTMKKLPEYFDDESTRHRVGGMVWSPDSKRIAFTNRSDVFVIDLKGTLQRLTHTTSGESQLGWSPDGRFVSFLRGGSLWLLDVDGAREIQVMAPLGNELSINEVHWAPDSRRVAFLVQDDTGRGELVVPNYLPQRVKNESVREGYPQFSVRIADLHPLYKDDDPNALRQVKPFNMRTLDLGSGKHPWVTPVSWSPDGKWLAVNETAEDMRTRTVHVADASNGKVRTAYTEKDSAWIEDFDWVITDQAVLEWSPDSRWLAFTSERSGFHQLYRVDVRPDSIAAPERLTQGDWTVDWAKWLPDGEHIVMLTGRKTTSERHLERLAVKTGALEQLATATGMNTHPLLGRNGRVLVYRHSRFATPPDLWAIEPKPGSQPRQLTHTVPKRFTDVAWTVPEIVRFPARDGVQLAGLLYKPTSFDPAARYPVVVFVHGAGSMQNVVDGWTIYAPNFKFHSVLAQRGFVVFEVDYRGSLGYGHDFRAGVLMHMGGKDLDDELAGVDYLKTLPYVDASRIGIYGGSYGGFMALMALFLAPQEYACGAALRFVTDWENYYRGNPWYCIQRLGKPEDNPAAYYRSSPLHFAENLADPLLLLHGVRDDNVHFQDAAQLVERLIRAGKDFELMMYPVERHGFTEPESWIDEYGRMQRFFERHLQGGEDARGTAHSGAMRD
jgi:dipeptidyl aminopeptidase/acylaminoacyl peptidase